MIRIFSGSIRTKLGFFAFLLILATNLLLYAVNVRITERHITEEVIKKAEALSGSIATAAGYSFSSHDLLGLDNLVYRARERNPDVEYVAVVDSQGKAVVHSDIGLSGRKLEKPDGRAFITRENGTTILESGNSRKGLFEFSTPVTFLGKEMGYVIVGIDRTALITVQESARRSTLAIFAVTTFLGIFGSFILSHFLTRPIKELSSGVDSMIGGRRDIPLRVLSGDELGRLTESFNEMTRMIAEQEGQLGNFARDLEESYVSMVEVLAASIDARDPYTHGHSTRVSALSLRTGREMGLSEEACRDLEVACLFHDIGKLKTPDSILRKKASLNSAEHREMMRHVEYGSDILAKAPTLRRHIPPVRHHHEWYDGRGYPDGLQGDEIPVFAAIIGIADAYDAMTTDRPYRRARTHEEAMHEIASCAGSQFHPDILPYFTSAMAGGFVETEVGVLAGEQG